MPEDSSYIFENAKTVSEEERLQFIESVFDSATENFLAKTGIEEGWSCLEVGAGAGSACFSDVTAGISGPGLSPGNVGELSASGAGFAIL